MEFSKYLDLIFSFFVDNSNFLILFSFFSEIIDVYLLKITSREQDFIVIHKNEYMYI